MREAEAHLANWAQKHKFLAKCERGYDGESAGFISGGVSSIDAFDEMCEDMDLQTAHTVDQIINGVAPDYKSSLKPIHAAAILFYYSIVKVYSFRDPVDVIYPKAVEEFWQHGQKLGLS